MSTLSRHVRRYKRHRNWLPIVLFIILMILTLAVAGILLFRSMEPEQTESETELPPHVEIPADTTDEEAEALRSHYERKENFYTILVSGADDGNGNSDTNILVAVDAAGGSIYGVSIPRDTHTYFNDKDRKINSAYSIGGMELLSEVTSDLLGIPVDYTVKVDLQGFEALVNAIGGVYFDVPLDMDYDTLGGLVFSHLTEIPEDGERPVVECFGLRISVTEVADRRVEWALVEKLATEESEETRG